MREERILDPELLQAFHDKSFATPVIGVTGGKGGVGKTTVAVNLAFAIAAMGFRVALVDGDVDNPNAAIILDMGPANPCTAPSPAFARAIPPNRLAIAIFSRAWLSFK